MDLEQQIRELLKEYGDEAVESVREIIPKVAKDAAKKLRSESPKRSGKYAKGWTQKAEQTNLGVTGTVYNKAAPGLAHLLEYGHAKRSGGRTRPRPHIQPVEEWASDEAVKRITEALQ